MTGKVRHGHTRKNSKTYRAWSAMWQRCTNPNNQRYRDYGGRGISICIRWSLFENFLEDMGLAPENSILDRKYNEGHYKPSNCKWSSLLESNRNSRRVVLDLDKARIIREEALCWKGNQWQLCLKLGKQLSVDPEVIRGVLRGNWK